MMGTQDATIFNYITSQEALYKLPISINEAWQWSMFDHIKTTVLYKNSQLLSGKDDFKPVKNITRPILNLQYRAEGFDVKDIQLFVDDADDYYKSLLIRKFHERWARENNLDTFIDQLVESYVDFGGALIKDVDDVKPEVVPLQSIAFCDQSDILSGPIGIKHYFSPDQLLAMADRGWGSKAKGADLTLKEAITLALTQKMDVQNNVQITTPGKYVEVYEVHGNLPRRYLEPETDQDDYVSQLQIVCFYVKDGNRQGVTLYKSEEKELPFKFLARDAIYGRTLGMGGAEELFEPQVWVNYDMIRMQDMLDAASKTILKATGTGSATIASKNKLRDMENLSIIDAGPDGDLGQVDTFPRNMKLFEDSVQQWEAHAQQVGAANDAIMGQSPSAGTPFKLQELVTQEAHSLHEYRKGKLASFLDEIYRDWVIPFIAKEITKGTEFLTELDMDELQYVNDAIKICYTNDMIKQKILNGDLIEQDQVAGYKDLITEQLKKQGNKRFIEILAGEFKDSSLDVKTNIAGKQKNLAQQVDKIVNIFRFAFSNPQGFAQTMQIPGMAKGFNQILEFSGLSPADFSGIDKIADKLAQQAQPQPASVPQQSPLLPTQTPINA